MSSAHYKSMHQELPAQHRSRKFKLRDICSACGDHPGPKNFAGVNRLNANTWKYVGGYKVSYGKGSSNCVLQKHKTLDVHVRAES